MMQGHYITWLLLRAKLKLRAFQHTDLAAVGTQSHLNLHHISELVRGIVAAMSSCEQLKQTNRRWHSFKLNS